MIGAALFGFLLKVGYAYVELCSFSPPAPAMKTDTLNVVDYKCTTFPPLYARATVPHIFLRCCSLTGDIEISTVVGHSVTQQGLIQFTA